MRFGDTTPLGLPEPDCSGGWMDRTMVLGCAVQTPWAYDAYPYVIERAFLERGNSAPALPIYEKFSLVLPSTSPGKIRRVLAPRSTRP